MPIILACRLSLKKKTQCGEENSRLPRLENPPGSSLHLYQLVCINHGGLGSATCARWSCGPGYLVQQLQLRSPMIPLPPGRRTNVLVCQRLRFSHRPHRKTPLRWGWTPSFSFHRYGCHVRGAGASSRTKNTGFTRFVECTAFLKERYLPS